MNYLSIASVVRDENLNLPEWIEYHRLVGVEHFYLMDDRSRIPLRVFLKAYIQRGIVTVWETKLSGQSGQKHVYNDILGKTRGESQWMAFIDVDEFLIPKRTYSLKEALSGFEKFGGLVVNWALFGSQGYVRRPHGLRIENYWMRCPGNDPACRFVKSVVQTDRVASCPDPHAFLYRDEFFAVGEDGRRLNGRHRDATYYQIQLNHYWGKSREEFAAKLKRGEASGSRYKWGEFESVFRRSIVKDETAFRFADQVRARLLHP